MLKHASNAFTGILQLNFFDFFQEGSAFPLQFGNVVRDALNLPLLIGDLIGKDFKLHLQFVQRFHGNSPNFSNPLSWIRTSFALGDDQLFRRRSPCHREHIREDETQRRQKTRKGSVPALPRMSF